jgi:hypothetical protein
MKMRNIRTGVACDTNVSYNLSCKDNISSANSNKKAGREACKKLPALMVRVILN